MQTPIKVALCLPWYAGADRDCVTHFLQFQHYLGRLQERLDIIAAGGTPPPSKLDPSNTTGFSEIPPEMHGTRLQFGISDEIGCSLPGVARERCVDNALAWGADFLLFYDADMLFGTDLFLRLFLAKKPVVAALAFTGREPITPVIYKFKDYRVDEKGQVSFDSQVVFNYEKNKLQKADAVGGGVFMVDAAVFRAVPKPWFATNAALGEDIYFCARCKMLDIDVWVHTGAQTIHKPTFHRDWHDEVKYLRDNPSVAEAKIPSIPYAPEPDHELAREINDVAVAASCNGEIYEGSSTLPQLQFIAQRVSMAVETGYGNICEVGFNAGMSSVAMLHADLRALVTSFDEGRWSCVDPAKKYIDDRYPGRHTLIKGNSIDTLAVLDPGLRFGFTLIDGGHDFPTAWSDINWLAGRSRHVMVDDTQMPGVKAALEKALLTGILTAPLHFEDRVGSTVPRKWALCGGGWK